MTKRHIGWSSFPRSKEVQGNKRHQKRQIIKQRQAIFRVCMLCHAMPSLALRSWQATKTGASQVQDSAWEGSSSGGLAHKMQNDANVQEVPPKRKSQVYKMSADIHSSCTHVVPRCTMLYHSAHRTRFVTISYLFFFLSFWFVLWLWWARWAQSSEAQVECMTWEMHTAAWKRNVWRCRRRCRPVGPHILWRSPHTRQITSDTYMHI